MFNFIALLLSVRSLTTKPLRSKAPQLKVGDIMWYRIREATSLSAKEKAKVRFLYDINLSRIH